MLHFINIVAMAQGVFPKIFSKNSPFVLLKYKNN